MPPKGSTPLKAMEAVEVVVERVKFWPVDAFATSKNVRLLSIPDGVKAGEVAGGVGWLPIRTKVIFPGIYDCPTPSELNPAKASKLYENCLFKENPSELSNSNQDILHKPSRNLSGLNLAELL